MASSSSSASSPQQYRSRFGDTTWTKVFVGGLAWETPTEELRRHFEPFGDILEAVIISDKATGRSKGYGFVTFRDPEAAQRAVADQNPVIDGRRANCNIASMGRPRTSPRQQGRSQQEGSSMPQGVGPTHARLPAHMAPQVIYPTAYGYMASYPSEYGYQQAAAVYSAQMAAAPPYYYPQLYGPTTSPTNVAPPPYQHHYPNLGLGFALQSPRAAAFPSPAPAPRPPPPLMHHLPAAATHMEPSPMPSSSPHNYFFHLHAPPHASPPPPPPPLNSTALDSSRAQREPSSTSTGADHTDDNRDA